MRGNNYKGLGSLPNEPLVSIVINVHNGKKFIREAIESVYDQTYKNYEIVVYDNLSTDGTDEIVKKYDKVKYFRSDKLHPLGKARNEAIKKSSGQVLGFLDCDDLWLPTKIEKQLPYFKDQVALVYCDTLFFGSKNHREVSFYGLNRVQPPSGKIFRQLLSNYFISLETVLIRRDALSSDVSKWYPEDFHVCEEADLFLRLSHDYEFAYVPTVLSKYRIHDGQLSISKADLFAVEQEKMLQRLKADIPEFKTLYKKETRSLEASVQKSKCEVFMKDKKRFDAFLCSFKACGKSPRLKYVVLLLFATFLNYSSYLKMRRLFGRS